MSRSLTVRVEDRSALARLIVDPQAAAFGMTRRVQDAAERYEAIMQAIAPPLSPGELGILARGLAGQPVSVRGPRWVSILRDQLSLIAMEANTQEGDELTLRLRRLSPVNLLAALEAVERHALAGS